MLADKRLLFDETVILVEKILYIRRDAPVRLLGECFLEFGALRFDLLIDAGNKSREVINRARCDVALVYSAARERIEQLAYLGDGGLRILQVGVVLVNIVLYVDHLLLGVGFDVILLAFKQVEQRFDLARGDASGGRANPQGFNTRC